MTIQGMRDWIKKHRNWIIVLFVLLVIGLVGTYATSGFRGSANKNNTASLEQQLEQSDALIAKARESLAANPTGYNEIYTLANELDQRGSMLSQVGQTEEAKPFLTEAVDLYMQALEHAPEDLNDAGRARLYLYTAGCYIVMGEDEKATTAFQTAIEMAPTDVTINMSYAEYLTSVNRLDEALQVATDFRAALPEGDENLEVADAYIEALQTMISGQENPQGEADDKQQE